MTESPTLPLADRQSPAPRPAPPLGASRRLTALVTGLMLVSIVGLTAWSWYDRAYNPDEANEIVTLREADSFWAYRDRVTNHFGTNVQFYLVSRLRGFATPHLQFFGALMASLAVLYAAWLGRRYRLFTRWSLLALLAVMGTNDALHHFGTWGLFNYGQAILVSVLVLHAMLMLASRGFALGWPATAALGAGLGLLVLNYGANVLPIVCGLCAAALWSVLPGARGDNAPRMSFGHVAGRAAAILGIVAAFTAVTLTWLTHGEFAQPRQVIAPLFFPTSEFEQSWRGMVGFVLEQSKAQAISVWEPNRFLITDQSAREAIAIALSLAFVIAMARSLVQWRRLRFVMALMLLAALTGLVVLSLRGSYAFGFVRYALFIHGPMLMMAALGVCDIIAALGVMVRRTADRFGLGLNEPRHQARLHLAVYVLAAIVVLGVQLRLVHNVAARALHFNQAHERMVGLLRATDAPWILTDQYTQTSLDYLRIEYPDRDTFLLDRPFLRNVGQTSVDLDVLDRALDRQERVLTVTYRPIDDPWYDAVRQQLESRFERAEQEGVNRLRVVDWRRRDDTPLVQDEP